MKRLLISLAIITALFIPVYCVDGQSHADGVFSHCGEGSANGTPDVCNDAQQQQGNNGNNNPIVGIIKAAINVISYVIGIAAIIGIIVSGIRLMTAGGDSNAVASARSGLIYSLIGIAVVALAQVLVTFVLDKVQ